MSFGLVINHNLGSMNALSALNNNQNALNTQLQRLSTGKQINSAADNAAGYAISQKMQSQIDGLNQASQNSQDGISLLQTANGALNETSSIIQNMRQLAVQASSDTNTSADRANLQSEVSQLTAEVNNISGTTQFNTMNLLDGSLGVQMTSTASNITGVNTTANTQTGAYSVSISTAATQAALGNTSSNATQAMNLNDASLSSTNNLTINGVSISLNGGTTTYDSPSQVLAKINAVSSQTGVTGQIGQNGGLILQSTDFGSSATINVSGSGQLLHDLGLQTSTSNTVMSAAGTDVVGTIDGSAATGSGVNLTSTTGNSSGLEVQSTSNATAATVQNLKWTAPGAADTITVNGVGIAVAKGTASAAAWLGTAGVQQSLANAGVTATANSDGTISFTSIATGKNAALSITDAGGATGALSSGGTADTLTATAGTDGFGTSAEVSVNTSGELQFQIGANNGQTMSVSIGGMSASDLGISNIDISTQAGATAAIKSLDSALSKVTQEQSNLGAYQNRLQDTISNLDTSSQNLTTAQSAITDTNMAQAMADFTKDNVLQQASISMLAQANQQPQLVLKLLG